MLGLEQAKQQGGRRDPFHCVDVIHLLRARTWEQNVGWMGFFRGRLVSAGPWNGALPFVRRSRDCGSGASPDFSLARSRTADAAAARARRGDGGCAHRGGHEAPRRRELRDSQARGDAVPPWTKMTGQPRMARRSNGSSTAPFLLCARCQVSTSWLVLTYLDRAASVRRVDASARPRIDPSRRVPVSPLLRVASCLSCRFVSTPPPSGPFYAS